MELQIGDFYLKLEGTIGLLIGAAPVMFLMTLPTIQKIVRRIGAMIKVRAKNKYSSEYLERRYGR
jgi:hypothetical protein